MALKNLFNIVKNQFKTTKRAFEMGKKYASRARDKFRKTVHGVHNSTKRGPIVEPISEGADFIKKVKHAIGSTPAGRFTQKVYDARNGRLFKGMKTTMKVAGFPAKVGVKGAMMGINVIARNPIKIAAAAGVGYGAYRGIQDANMRTQHLKGPRSMAPNHLGTDGLTLSLSKIRHR